MKKSILITGSTDGIGKLAAIRLAKDGHVIYLHGRNVEKLKIVINEIKVLSKNEQVSGFVADFSDLKEVMSMAQKLNSDLSRLDVLINNAGVFKSPVNKNPDGYDMRFAVNYFAPYILTNAVLPLIKNGSSPRIINLSSAAQASVSPEVLNGSRILTVQESYAQSKLALTMWNTHLSKTHSDITSIAVNPGSLLNTNMVREGYGRYWSEADKGGDIIYDLSTLKIYGAHSGAYYDNDQGKLGRAHDDAYNEVKIAALIKQTEEILNFN